LLAEKSLELENILISRLVIGAALLMATHSTFSAAAVASDDRTIGLLDLPGIQTCKNLINLGCECKKWQFVLSN